MTDAQAAALITAGRLLQSHRWPRGPVRIDRQTGETYPQAVARVVAALDQEDRDRLRGLVAWVLDYERHELTPAPAATSKMERRPVKTRL